MQFDNKLKKNNKGFTLLELLITVVILALITAPFLSSFASASKTNVKSKRIQEANELSQHIIEQFKGSSVAKMVNPSNYNMNPTNESIDSTDEKYRKNSTSYEKEVNGSTLGFPAGYTANIKLKPIKSIVNEDNAIPEIETLSKDNCLVLAGNITMLDSGVPTNVDSRYVRVKVWKDSSSSKYRAELTIQYREGDIDVGPVRNVGNWEYDVAPAIYILYVPQDILSPTAPDNTLCYDRIVIDNDLYEDKADGTTSTVNAYIIQQKAAKNASGIYTYKYPVVQSDRVSVEEKVNASMDVMPGNGVYLSDLLDTNDTTTLNNTVLHTNIGTGVTNDKGGSIYDAVKTVKIDTIYNLDVEVKYKGKHIASYGATKIKSGD